MEHVTFKHVYNPGQLIFQADRYQHYADNSMSLMYDRNFVEFNYEPMLNDLIATETYLKAYQNQHEQDHLRFTFPANKQLSAELANYFKDQGYTVGHVELYAIHPSHYSNKNASSAVTIHVVTAGNLERYRSLQYWQDFSYGVEFAKEKELDYRQRFENESMIQLLALYEDQAVGSVDIILGDKTAEIDNLFVEERYQNRGIGSMLQRKVMEIAKDKTVILVADGNDTARRMYKKQNYHCLEFRYEALKV